MCLELRVRCALDGRRGAVTLRFSSGHVSVILQRWSSKTHVIDSSPLLELLAPAEGSLATTVVSSVSFPVWELSWASTLYG